jgi:DNA-binding LacI/PurR family transcriptional regulator
VKRELLHERIARELRRELRATGRPGQRLGADTEQAARFGVSVITVREALRLLCAEVLLERRHGSGTYVRTVQRPPRIALLSKRAIFDRPTLFFHRHALHVAEETLRAAGAETELFLENGQPTGDSLLADLAAAQRYDGVLDLLASITAAGIAAAERAGLPVVTHSDNAHGHAVANDHVCLVREAVGFMVRHGRRRLAMIQPCPAERPAHGEEWYLRRAFRDSLAAAGVRFHADWVCDVPDDASPGAGWEQFRALWRHGGARPDGLLIGMDTLYPATAMAVLDLGVRVPHDLLVVSHANRGAGMFCPFPTVRFEFDAVRFGRALAERLFARLRGEAPAPPVLMLPPEAAGVTEVEAALGATGAATPRGGRARP